MMAEPQQAAADPVADILRSVPAPDAVRADAWNRYEAATNADDLAAQLKDVPLARSVKAQLWSLKNAAQPHDIALTIGAPTPPPIMTPTGPVGMGNTTDAADQPSGRIATLAAELERAALPRHGVDLAGLLLQQETGEALMHRLVMPALAPVIAGAARYGGATADLLTSLLPTKARAAIGILRDLNPSSWNSPLTIAGRDARAATQLARDVAAQVHPYMPNRSGVPDLGVPTAPLLQPSLDRFMPNKAGLPDAGIPTGPLPQSSAVLVDHQMPNRPGVPDAGVPTGPLAQPSLDRLMPNRAGVPDGGIPQGPLPQPAWSIDHVMPNRSGVPTTAPGTAPRVTEQQLVQLLREHDAAVGGTAVAKAHPILPAPTGPAVPLPKFTTHDVIAIKSLIAHGATQAEAVDAIIKLRGYPAAWQSFAISRVLRPPK